MKEQKPIRILVAEDDFMVSKSITQTLNDIGYEQVGLASNGEEVVEMTRSLQPDVILMDIKMPKLDGLQAARQIQENSPTPIVILTAYDSQELVKEASKSGVGALLLKPPEAFEIEKAVTIAMARHNDLMELCSLNKELQIRKQELEKSLAEIKTLRGILPICANCKKIRDDKGYWNQIESYIHKHSEAEFTHGICPECMKKLYPDFV
ncbi:MAG: response regulator [Proteobacteria bacterium]|nr:response regulator [Pseudomonadota bacterium]MCG2830995.1 response regulator [Desulfobacteraceae bacterium]